MCAATTALTLQCPISEDKQLLAASASSETRLSQSKSWMLQRQGRPSPLKPLSPWLQINCAQCQPNTFGNKTTLVCSSVPCLFSMMGAAAHANLEVAVMCIHMLVNPCPCQSPFCWLVIVQPIKIYPSLYYENPAIFLTPGDPFKTPHLRSQGNLLFSMVFSPCPSARQASTKSNLSCSFASKKSNLSCSFANQSFSSPHLPIICADLPLGWL
jgi:hypothetical protein